MVNHYEAVPQIVVVSGLPCSGKSKFAAHLRARWQRPLLCKDTFKESLFDTLGVVDRNWSKRLSTAAYRLMFLQAEELLLCGLDCIVEGNFRKTERRESFTRLRDVGASFFQVHCRADADVLVARFRERAHSGRRHLGHVDVESLPEIELELRSSIQDPLPLDGVLMECDTTHDWQSAIGRTVEELLSSLRG